MAEQSCVIQAKALLWANGVVSECHHGWIDARAIRVGIRRAATPPDEEDGTAALLRAIASITQKEYQIAQASRRAGFHDLPGDGVSRSTGTTRAVERLFIARPDIFLSDEKGRPDNDFLSRPEARRAGGRVQWYVLCCDNPDWMANNAKERLHFFGASLVFTSPAAQEMLNYFNPQ